MDNENVRDANLNGRMSYSRRYIQKNYRWGDKLISLEELRQQEKFEQRNLKFYRRDYYDHYRQWESDKLTKQWLALPKNKLRYWGDTQGCWHRSVPEAAKASGLDKLAYQHRLDKGKVKRRVEYLISLNDYILSKTRFPDPIVPNQDQITKKKG
jgi:hypothetical protein